MSSTSGISKIFWFMRTLPNTPPAHTTSKNRVANSGKSVQMLPPATTTLLPRRKWKESWRMRSKSGCSPLRKTMS